MQLINNDIPQILKKLDPLGVMRKNSAMQHIRIGHDDVSGLAYRFAGRCGRISVIGIGFNGDIGLLDDFIEFANLIGRQGLGWEKINGPRRGICLLYTSENKQMFWRKKEKHEKDVYSGRT